MTFSGQALPSSFGRRWWAGTGRALLFLGLGLGFLGPPEVQALPQSVEVRNLGLSRVGERTMVTVLLDQAINPKVSPYTGAQRAQLVIDFPHAFAGKLPETLAGDEVLVKQLRTEVLDTGVRIILEMFPERPYLFQRELLPMKGGGAMFRLDLRPDPSALPAKQPPATTSPVPPPEPTPRAAPGPVTREEPPPVTPAPRETAPPSVGSLPPSGDFAEIYRLIPQARGLWDFLRGDGWGVAQAQSFDSPGKRFSRSFVLSNSRYPELRVRIAHVAPSGSGAPSINIVDLAMDVLEGKAAEDYRKMRQWSLSQIKTKHEDIGDFFEDALKPLRVEIRKKCQDLAQRRAQFIGDFLRQAVPQNPKLGEEAITLIRKKVSPRFEGVQYTLSENPLTILNLVDFFYIRVYYLSR